MKDITKKKELGQVFTPTWAVKLICDHCGYTVGGSILGKYVMENGCGYGAFLCEIVERYCQAYLSVHMDCDNLKSELETYIYGIEIDLFLHHRCLEELDKVAARYTSEKVNWNILHGDAIAARYQYKGRFDFVIGNPPYVRKHFLSQKIRSAGVQRLPIGAYSVPDLYVLFYDMGLTMLAEGGTLALLTPKVWMRNKGGAALRAYFEAQDADVQIIEFNQSMFDECVQVALTIYQSGSPHSGVSRFQCDTKTGRLQLQSRQSYSCFLNFGKWYEGNPPKQIVKILTKSYRDPTISIKNSILTMADSVFILDNTERIEPELILPVIKGLTLEQKTMLFPYKHTHSGWIPYSESELEQSFPNAYRYLLENKAALERRCITPGTPWYALGRSQGITSIASDKCCATSLYSGAGSLRIAPVPSGAGVYGGGFIIESHIDYAQLKAWLSADTFWQYVQAVGNERQNGYYQITTADMHRYLSYFTGKEIGAW